MHGGTRKIERLIAQFGCLTLVMVSLGLVGPPAQAQADERAPEAGIEAEPNTVRLQPTDDTFVWDRAPALAAGNRPKLKTGLKWAGPRLGEMTSYLRFSVPEDEGALVSATLRLWVENGSTTGGTVFATETDWDEQTANYRTRPALIGAPIAEIGAVASSTWVEVDVTSAVEAGDISFALVSESRDLAKYATKESFRSPELAVARADDLFFEERRIAVGNRPASVAVAELSGDGFVDLMISDVRDDAVWVLVGDGVGGFTIAGRVAVGEAPVDVAAADVNGDSFVDVVVANAGSDDVSILIGDGAGGFVAQVPLGVGHAPLGMALADASGDGVLDIVTANRDSSDVSVLVGDGAGGFASAQHFSTGPEYNGDGDVAVADLSGDGVPDIVTAGESISVLLGDGVGGFEFDMAYPGGESPTTVVVADYSNDGVPDIANTTGQSGGVSLLRGDGDGRFTRDQAVSVGSGSGTTGLAVADVSGDGLLDLVIGIEGQLAVALADGNGGFLDEQLFEVGPETYGVAVADLTGDGKPDVVAANRGSGDISVFVHR